MTLVGIGALAVYAGAAFLVLFAASRGVRPIRARVALALAAAPLIFTGRATVTGGVYAPLDILYGAAPFAAIHRGPIPDARTPLLSDVVCSSIPWHAAVRDALTHWRWPIWNRFVLAGEPLLAVQQSAALHPATWFGLLLPLPQAWTLQMSLRLLLALVAAYLLAREFGAGEIAALAGAAAWAFSDFVVFWLGFSVTNAIGPFPLLALGLLRLARDADWRASGLTSVSLALIVLGGHPEMLLFAVAAGGVWFLFRLAEAPPARRRRAILLAAGAGVLALGVTAVQLAPLLEAMPQTFERAFREAVYATQRKSVAPIESARRAAVLALPIAYGVSGHGRLADGFGVPGAYAGAILFPLAWAGLLAPGRRALRASLAVPGLLGVALWARLAGPTDAVASLPLFRIGVLDYFVFAAVFALAMLAALGAERLTRGEGRAAFFAGAAAAAAAIGALYLARRPWMRELGMSDAFTASRLAWELAPLAAGALLVAAAARPGRGALAAGGCLALLLASRAAEAGGVYPTMPASAFYPRVAALDAIPRGTPDRMTALGAMLVPNAAAVYGLEDVRGYESMTFLPFVQTYPLWSRPLAAWFNIVDDLRRPFLAFLNVRWALVAPGTSPPPGWAVRTRTAAADLLENKGSLPRAFVPAFLRIEPEPGERMKQLQAITDFWQRGIVSELIDLGTAHEWLRNGDATATIARYEPHSMTLAVDARGPAVVATSIPAWKGWRVMVDGTPAETLTYNHAFVALEVPQGRHEVQLRYLPTSFGVGLVVSVATLAAAALLLRDVRKRGVPARPASTPSERR